MFVPLTPLAFKQRAAQLYGDKIGVIDGEDRFTYAQFAERADRLAHGLHDLGLETGDRVAFLAFNSHQLLEGYYGVPGAGGILLPINIRLTPDEIAYILQDAGVRFVFADPDFAPLVDAIVPKLPDRVTVVWLGRRPEGQEGVEYEHVLASASSEPVAAAVDDENGVAELFYTSGTTGRPKGVMLTHRALYLHALYSLISLHGGSRDVQLHTIPLFHVNGWGTPQTVTAVGGTHVMLRKFDPAEALRLIEAERVTRFAAVPTMLTMLLSHPDVRTRDLRSLEEVTMGGSPVPPEMIRQGEDILGCRIVSGYGLSETSPVLTFSGNPAGLEGVDEKARVWRQASTGQPIVGVDLALLDDDGRTVLWDGQSRGEIVARSNVVMEGYWHDPEGTEAVLHDGWFHTGDIATADPHGYFLIVDRKKDIIISGGENISSVEIEKALYEHPAVLEAAVVGIPDDTWGEVPLALITLRPGASAGEKDLIDYCRQHLGGFKVPRAVEFRDFLPKGGTGKILKRALREPYWQGRAKQVH